jgi:ATP-dependent exoDNAse (exonuclease V) beta subunit
MDSKTFEVYRTSAGAGKTFAIVKEYILLCLQKRSRFDQIVALTFTNKAANEMKDRLLEYLFFIAHHPNAREDVREMIFQISEETGMDTSSISASSQQLLSDILHQYARFAISTIDSFIHDILRVFSNDLRLPDNFRVETDVSAVADAIVDELVHELEFSDQDPELSLLTAYIVELSLQNFEEKDSWDITRELKKYSKLLFSEDSIEVVENLSRCSVTEISEIAGRITQLEEDVYSRIRRFASEAMHVISEASLSTDDFFRKGDGIGAFFKRLSDARRGSRMNYNSYILQAVEQDKWESGKNNKVSTAVRKSFGNCFSGSLRIRCITIWN